MKSITGFVIALFIVGGNTTDAGAAVLRSAVTVEADVVRLGDLFADVGDKRDKVVATAPKPGKKARFNASQLQSIARRAKLSWRPESRYMNIVVTRAGHLISTEEIERKIRRSLLKAGLPTDRQIALSKTDLTVNIAPDEKREIRILNPRFTLRSKRFSAIIEIPKGNGGAERIQVNGSLFEVVAVPVLSARVRRGETIRARNVEFVEMRRDAIARNTVIDKDRIIGRSARRLLTASKPIQIGDLRMPVLVAKGKLVTLVLRNKNILITARGKALENGAKGDVIQVANTRSRNTVQGVVVGPNRVAIDFPNAIP